jgi:hypothetical protein
MPDIRRPPKTERAAREAVARLGHISVRFYEDIAPAAGGGTTLGALRRLAKSGEFRFEGFEADDGSLWGWFMPAATFALPSWAARKAELPK